MIREWFERRRLRKRDARLLSLRESIGKHHDFTNSGWGHAIHDHNPPKDAFAENSVLGHGCGIAVGDAIVRSGMKYPRLLYYVVAIKYFSDPSDMFEATLQYVGAEEVA